MEQTASVKVKGNVVKGKYKELQYISLDLSGFIICLISFGSLWHTVFFRFAEREQIGLVHTKTTVQTKL